MELFKKKHEIALKSKIIIKDSSHKMSYSSGSSFLIVPTSISLWFMQTKWCGRELEQDEKCERQFKAIYWVCLIARCRYTAKFDSSKLYKIYIVELNWKHF